MTAIIKWGDDRLEVIFQALLILMISVSRMMFVTSKNLIMLFKNQSVQPYLIFQNGRKDEAR